MRKVNHPTLAQWLSGWMAREGLKQADVSNALGYNNNGAISMIITGKRGVPSDREAVDAWVRALRIRDEESESIFRTLVGLYHSPDWIVDDYWRHRTALADARKKLKQQDERLDELTRLVSRLKRER